MFRTWYFHGLDTIGGESPGVTQSNVGPPISSSPNKLSCPKNCSLEDVINVAFLPYQILKIYPTGFLFVLHFLASLCHRKTFVIIISYRHLLIRFFKIYSVGVP